MKSVYKVVGANMPILDEAEKRELKRLEGLDKKGLFALSRDDQQRLNALKNHSYLEKHLAALELQDKTFVFDEIKPSYRKLALIHHPDKNGIEEKFKAVSCANDWLNENEAFVKGYIAIRHTRERLLPKRNASKSYTDFSFNKFFKSASASASTSTSSSRTGSTKSSTPTYLIIRIHNASLHYPKKFDFKIKAGDTSEQLKETILDTFRNQINSRIKKIEIISGTISTRYKEAIIRAALELKSTDLEVPYDFVDEEFCKPLVKILDDNKSRKNYSSYSLKLSTSTGSIEFISLLRKAGWMGICGGISEVKVTDYLSTDLLNSLCSALTDCLYLRKVELACQLLSNNLKMAIDSNLDQLYHLVILKKGGSKETFWGRGRQEFEDDWLSIQALLLDDSITIEEDNLNLPKFFKEIVFPYIVKYRTELKLSGRNINVNLCDDFIGLKNVSLDCIINKQFTLQWKDSSISFNYHLGKKKKNAVLTEVCIKNAGYSIMYGRQEKALVNLLKTCTHLTKVELPNTYLHFKEKRELNNFTKQNQQRQTIKNVVKKLTPFSHGRTWLLLGMVAGLSCSWYLGYTFATILFYTLISGMGARLFAAARKKYLAYMGNDRKEEIRGKEFSSAHVSKEMIDALKCGEAAAHSTLAYFKHFVNKNTYTHYRAYCAGMDIGLDNEQKLMRKIRTI